MRNHADLLRASGRCPNCQGKMEGCRGWCMFDPEIDETIWHNGIESIVKNGKAFTHEPKKAG